MACTEEGRCFTFSRLSDESCFDRKGAEGNCSRGNADIIASWRSVAIL